MAAKEAQELIRHFEGKIKTTINRVWGDKGQPAQLGENP